MSQDRADYERFANYADARATDDGGRVFVEGGDLARLKQSLCRAWKQSVGGLTFGEGAPTASKFADLLTSCGIPTKRHDVENGARNPFRPKSVPRTTRCIGALEEVGRLLQSIRPEEFLAAEDDALLPFAQAGDEESVGSILQAAE